MTKVAPARASTHLDLVPYDPSWPQRFARTAQELRDVLPDARIEHVGSTSVPGMASKDTIDTAVGVDGVDAALTPEVLARLAQRAFVHRPESFADDPDHAFLARIVADHRTDHVHVMRTDSQTYRDRILLRDFLRSRPGAAAEYTCTKRRLAVQYADRRAEYVDRKAVYVDALMQRVREAI